MKCRHARGAALAAVLVLSLGLVGCGGSAEEPTGGQAPETTVGSTPDTTAPTVPETSQVAATVAEDPSGEATSGEAVSADSADVVEHLREETTRFWEAYNGYDVDALTAFYEEDYWAEQEDEVRSNMQPFELYGMTIAATETSPPTEIAPGMWEIRHNARFAGSSLEMVFVFEQFDGEWLLTYAEVQ